MATRRALHFVFKIADRTSTIRFYREVLGMQVLRHEEFKEGCKAACNGPYDGMWSKSMVGYGKEDDHFVVELTYNYTVPSYRRGNDYQNIRIFSKTACSNIKAVDYSYTELEDGAYRVEAPGGYPFLIYNQDPPFKDPVQSVCLGITDLAKSIEYWNGLLGMRVYSRDESSVVLGYDDAQAKLKLCVVESVDHADAFGRIAFSCPRAELPPIQESVQKAGYKILTPLVSLDTPGKATVEVVILADPDGHEICFVGDEAFRELSQVDPKADELIDKAIGEDNSEEWLSQQEAKKSKTTS